MAEIKPTLIFTFAFSPPHFFPFSFPFFSFGGYLLGFILLGKDFEETQRIPKYFYYFEGSTVQVGTKYCKL